MKRLSICYHPSFIICFSPCKSKKPSFFDQYLRTWLYLDRQCNFFYTTLQIIVSFYKFFCALKQWRKILTIEVYFFFKNWQSHNKNAVKFWHLLRQSVQEMTDILERRQFVSQRHPDCAIRVLPSEHQLFWINIFKRETVDIAGNSSKTINLTPNLTLSIASVSGCLFPYFKQQQMQKNFFKKQAV